MITVVKEFTFDAAHYLPGYKGLCQNLHGHTYKLQIGVKGEINRDNGMVLDFKELKEIAQPYINYLDHSYLNENKAGGFPVSMPTAENMVEWLAGRLVSDLAWMDSSLRLHLVRLYETPTSYAEWRA